MAATSSSLPSLFRPATIAGIDPEPIPTPCQIRLAPFLVDFTPDPFRLRPLPSQPPHHPILPPESPTPTTVDFGSVHSRSTTESHASLSSRFLSLAGTASIEGEAKPILHSPESTSARQPAVDLRHHRRGSSMSRPEHTSNSFLIPRSLKSRRNSWIWSSSPPLSYCNARIEGHLQDGISLLSCGAGCALMEAKGKSGASAEVNIASSGV